MPPIHRVERLEDLPNEPPDADFVMVDVILASTSVVRLLEAGVAYVQPFFTKEDALAFGDRVDDAVLVGEQGGVPIDEFDLPPLPSILAEADLEGMPVGLLTSNGTRVVERVGVERSLFVGCPANAAAVGDVLRERDRETWLIAAGRQGSPTPEDTAGVDLLEATIAGERTSELVEDALERVRESPTAEWIAGSGLEDDIASVTDLDSSSVVPSLEDGRFVPA